MRILVTCTRCQEPCVKHRRSLTKLGGKPFYICGACSDERAMLKHFRMGEKYRKSGPKKRESQRRNVAAFMLQHPGAKPE